MAYILQLLRPDWHLSAPSSMPRYTQPLPLLLLAYLSLNGTQSRSDLGLLFWPQEGNAQTRLKGLSDLLRPLRKISPTLFTDNTTRHTLSSDVRSDVYFFQKDIDQGMLEPALSTYRGLFFDQIEHNQKVALHTRPQLLDWVLMQREQYALLVFDSTLELAERFGAQGKYPEAAELAWQAFDGLFDQEMLTYEDYKRLYLLLLAAHDPRHLILKQQASQILASEMSMSNTHASWPTTPQYAQEQLSIPNNLPVANPFHIGRQQELQQLTKRLQTPTSRLITLIGLAGVGKTHLALESARALLGHRRFSDGIYLVMLEDISHPQGLLSAISRALGLETTYPDSLTSLTTALQHKYLLLVLDNFEHVIKGARLLQQLLDLCPEVCLLVTSRVRLQVASEQCFPLYGLAYPSVTTPISATDLAEYGALELFVAHAKTVAPHYTFTSEDLPHIRHICQLVDGAPLGILLAATWISSASCETIAQQIKENITFLSRDSSDAPKRHQSIMATFDYSWAQLSAEEQADYQTLAVFHGLFTLEAAQAITQNTPHSLRSFCDKSLLDWQKEHSSYRLHPLLKQCVTVHFSHADNATQVKEAHTLYYLTYLNTHHRNRTALLTTTTENIKQAWLEAAKAYDLTLIHTSVLALEVMYGQILGDLPEGLALLKHSQHTLQECVASRPLSAQQPPPLYHEVMLQLKLSQSVLHLRKGEGASAKRCTEDAHSHLDFCPPQSHISHYKQEALIALHGGQYQQAAQHYETVLQKYQALLYPRQYAVLRANLGNIYYSLGKYAEGKHLQAPLFMAEPVVYLLQKYLTGLHDLHCGRYVQAASYFKDLIAEADQHTVQQWQVAARKGLLRALVGLRESQKAIQLAHTWLHLSPLPLNQRQVAEMKLYMSYAYVQQHAWSEAKIHLHDLWGRISNQSSLIDKHQVMLGVLNFYLAYQQSTKGVTTLPLRESPTLCPTLLRTLLHPHQQRHLAAFLHSEFRTMLQKYDLVAEDYSNPASDPLSPPKELDYLFKRDLDTWLYMSSVPQL